MLATWSHPSTIAGGWTANPYPTTTISGASDASGNSGYICAAVAGRN